MGVSVSQYPVEKIPFLTMNAVFINMGSWAATVRIKVVLVLGLGEQGGRLLDLDLHLRYVLSTDIYGAIERMSTAVHSLGQVGWRGALH